MMILQNVWPPPPSVTQWCFTWSKTEEEVGGRKYAKWNLHVGPRPILHYPPPQHMFPSPQHIYGYFLLQEGGGIVKFTCEGANQCIFVMFPSPQPMFGIYFRLVLVIFLLQVGGGRNVKFTCEGAKQCIFVMFPSPSFAKWGLFVFFFPA